MPRKTDDAARSRAAALSPLLAAAALAAPLALKAAPPAPDFGPHVHILSPSTPGLQQRILDIYEAQQPNHFGPRRDAILLLPGTYENLRIPVGAAVTWLNDDSAPHDATDRGGAWETDRLSRGDE